MHTILILCNSLQKQFLEESVQAYLNKKSQIVLEVFKKSHTILY